MYQSALHNGKITIFYMYPPEENHLWPWNKHFVFEIKRPRQACLCVTDIPAVCSVVLYV